MNEVPTQKPVAGPATADWSTWFEVQQFLFREARLLDACRYGEWLKLLTDDIHYWMPVIENRLGRGEPHRYEVLESDTRMMLIMSYP